MQWNVYKMHVIEEQNIITPCLPIRMHTNSSEDFVLTIVIIFLTKSQCSHFFWRQAREKVQPNQLDQTGVAVLISVVCLLFCGLCIGVLVVLRWRRRRFRLTRTSGTRNPRNTTLPKKYDAFVSYVSHKTDDNFVYKILFPKLEKEMGFRLCIHHRDFTPGEGTFRKFQQTLIKTILKLEWWNYVWVKI